MALFYIGCGDACFKLGLFMLDKQFIFGLLCLGLAVCVMILMVYTLLSFPRLKARMIFVFFMKINFITKIVMKFGV